MAKEEPKLDPYLTEPKFERFRNAIDKLEWTGDNPETIESMSPTTIANRYEEARLAYAEGNYNATDGKNYYPAENSPPDLRAKQAATEARMRNLYQHLRIFERCLEPQEKDGDSSVLDVPGPDTIMKELSEYRGRVREMGLTEHQSAVFYLFANDYAEAGLRRAEVPDQRINELLGPQHRPVRAIIPAPKPEGLDKK